MLNILHIYDSIYTKNHLPASIYVHKEVQSWDGKITLQNYPNSK